MSEEKQENKRTIKDFQREKRMRERITKKPDTQIGRQYERGKKENTNYSKTDTQSDYKREKTKKERIT